MPSGNTTLTAVGGLPSAALGNATSETIFAGGKTGNLILNLTQSGELANHLIRFKFGGRLQPGTTGTFRVRLYAGSSIVSANQMFDTNAVSCTGNSNFLCLVDCFWDSLSKSFCGVGYGQMGNTALGITQLPNQVTADPNAALLATNALFTQPFILTGQFGTSNASNSAFIDLYEADT
jgi:hypothetical protein